MDGWGGRGLKCVVGKKFPRIRWYNLHNALTASVLSITSSSLKVEMWIKKIHWHHSSPWGCGQRKHPEKGRTKFVFSSRQCSSTPVDFGQGFFSKEQSDNTFASLILSWRCSSWFLTGPSTEISFCDAIDIISNATEKLKRLSQRSFQECFQHLYSRWQNHLMEQREYCEGNTGWMLLCFVYLRYKVIPEYFEATAYNGSKTQVDKYQKPSRVEEDCTGSQVPQRTVMKKNKNKRSRNPLNRRFDGLQSLETENSYPLQVSNHSSSIVQLVA
jgi:hypothetical protein